MKLPVIRLTASKDTGSILVVDINGDCVCMCDDEAMADAVVKKLNSEPLAEAAAPQRWSPVEKFAKMTPDPDGAWVRYDELQSGPASDK